MNLGFDNADTNNPTDSGNGALFGTPGDFLPGWKVFAGDHEAQRIGLNWAATGTGAITLVNTNFTGAPTLSVEGTYALWLIPNTHVPYVLSQTGDIPEQASLIHFLDIDAHVSLSVNGDAVQLDFFPRLLIPACCGFPGYAGEVNDVYGDVSRYAGSTVNLTFTTMVDPNSSLEPFSGLDSISFIVPEPSVLSLLFIGIAVCSGAWFRRINTVLD